MSKTTTTETETTEQARHTPGPWYATGPHVQSAVLNEDNYVCKAEGNTPEEAEANACLIAAAPELLEACKMLLRWCELENQDDPDIEELTLQTVHEHVEAAIARAEGGAS